jgi:redox-sensitive bicupin YhaK (pirin superfamily)
MKTMNLTKLSADERGQTELGWLHGRHTFSFGEYYDPNNMGFRTLRVINDDVIEPGGGFGTHPHRDMEIFTYVIEGELEHKDSMGNGRVIQAGDLQYMSAGSGVRHSEFNPSADRRTHLLQIWIQPQKPGGAPRYAEHKLGAAAQPDALTPLFAGQHRADAEFYFGKLATGKTVTVPVKDGRGVWIHMIAGQVAVADEVLNAGDGAGIEGADQIELQASRDAEFLVFVLA